MLTQVEAIFTQVLLRPRELSEFCDPMGSWVSNQIAAAPKKSTPTHQLMPRNTLAAHFHIPCSQFCKTKPDLKRQLSQLDMLTGNPVPEDRLV